MSGVKFQTRFLKTGNILREIDLRYKRARNLRPGLEAAAKEAQLSVREEFIGSFWKSYSGAKISWSKRKDNFNHPLLILSRRLFLDWTEGQPTITDRTFSIGSSLPYAEIHRGGSGADIQTSPLWNNIPPRPHGTRNPDLDESVRTKILDYILFGKQ
jgi:hypothetical protein